MWTKSYGFSLGIYRLTEGFPSHEKYGIISQLRRASVSIICNIAEGSKRRSQIDFTRFLNIAEGSASEVECLILLSADLNYIPKEALPPLVDSITEIQKMLFGLRVKIESDEQRF